ncbi:MAG: DUF4268 domain-containing protein [Dehalococcoidia bacterium]|nr:DUF4268 domain-containing protein [Dehalococcoidia bacterium]MYD51842.1 DUF4268 domain-containing protein [Dehalococcoidia bacterium]
MVELAKIEEVELREVWSNEPKDFTPWLKENVDQLGTALGIELDIHELEAPVGPFSLDLLAHDTDKNCPVIIENQLDVTDHTHLGQLLTYAAGYDASAVVWIAKEFREEHRAALDFLNSRTGDETRFFGVAVELWKIDRSRPAPHFKVVSAPNDWSIETKSSPSEVSERGRKYQSFFQPLMDSLRETSSFTRANKVRSAPPRNWISYSAGYLGIKYEAAFQIRDEEARVHVYIDNRDEEWNKSLLDQLMEDKESIESELGELVWEPLENRQACRIAAVQFGTIEGDQETLDEIREWMFDRLVDFERVFGPRLAELVE